MLVADEGHVPVLLYHQKRDFGITPPVVAIVALTTTPATFAGVALSETVPTV